MNRMTGPRRSRSAFIVALLIATLGLTAVLAYQAHLATASHRATAESVLRDYSTFAAWELTRLGREQLLSAMNHGLESVRRAHRAGQLAGALSEQHTCPSGCGSHQLLTAFQTSTADVRFTTAGQPLDPAVRNTLADAIARGIQDPEDFTCPSLAVVASASGPVTVVWRPLHDRGNHATDVVGFVTDAEFVAKVFDKVVGRHPLLPPTLVPSGSPNGALAVRVTAPGGHRLFASSNDWSNYAASTTLPAAYGRLELAVALRPAEAGGLVIGGLPRERLPLLAGLLTLTAGLVVVALVQLRREAEISRLRADFVSGVSHELRTPLAQIRMFTETLLLGRVRSESEGRRSLEIIARESQRLAQLVENVLLFSRGERQRPQITRERTRLAPLVADVAESFAPLAAARQATIATDLDGGVVADVDGGAIRQILLNLFDNAVKYGPTGQTVTVTLSLDAGKARLAIDDEGPGVGIEDTESIWQPFNRLEASASATGGAGIGLAIVRQLAELHGGRAWVEPGAAGARFVVEIPGAGRLAAAAAAVA